MLNLYLIAGLEHVLLREQKFLTNREQVLREVLDDRVVVEPVGFAQVHRLVQIATACQRVDQFRWGQLQRIAGLQEKRLLRFREPLLIAKPDVAVRQHKNAINPLEQLAAVELGELLALLGGFVLSRLLVQQVQLINDLLNEVLVLVDFLLRGEVFDLQLL